MKKKLLLSALAIVVIFSAFGFGAYAATKYSVIVNGKQVALDVQIINDDAYVSAKKISELLGYKATVDTKSSKLTIGTSTVTLKSGEYQAKDFIFSDVQIKDTLIGWSVTAEVKSLKSVKGASFTISFFDANGKRVGSAVGSATNTTNGESRTITFVTMDDLKDWKTLRPQVDMSY